MCVIGVGQFLICGPFFVEISILILRTTPSAGKADEIYIYIYKCHVNQDSGCVILLPGLYVLEMC